MGGTGSNVDKIAGDRRRSAAVMIGAPWKCSESRRVSGTTSLPAFRSAVCRNGASVHVGCRERLERTSRGDVSNCAPAARVGESDNGQRELPALELLIRRNRATESCSACNFDKCSCGNRRRLPERVATRAHNRGVKADGAQVIKAECKRNKLSFWRLRGSSPASRR